MGQAKRRRQQLGDLYGTPEGSNSTGRIWPGLSPQGQIILGLQDVATADEQAWCITEPEGSNGPVVFRSNPPAADGDQGLWVPPIKAGAYLRFRHPVWVARSALSGKWAVMCELTQAPQILDVFHRRDVALRSAQNAQIALGQASAAEANGPAFLTLIHAYAKADEIDGIESDDEFLAVDQADLRAAIARELSRPML
jgi:hypothetical protein